MDPPSTSTPVALVLCDSEGAVLGILPTLAIPISWWNHAEPIVDAAREAFRQDLVVLRRLDTEPPHPDDRRLTYLAEVDALSATARDALMPWTGTLDEQDLRLPYAKPGGSAGDVAWAERVSAERRIEQSGPPVQVRFYLSSIWRLPLVDGESAWLKVVPPFFAHEGELLRRLQGGPVPRLLGHDGARLLLAEIPGADLYDAPLPVLQRMVRQLVELQAGWIGRTDELLQIGLPDWRALALTHLIGSAIDRHHAELAPEFHEPLDRFAAELPSRWKAIDACGVPDTMVHGDFHPGNGRGTPFGMTLLDWGDSGVGNPLLDLQAMLQAVPTDAVAPLRGAWFGAWSEVVPAADPAAALALLEPVAAAWQAVIYQSLVDRLELVEGRQYKVDVMAWLERCARLLTGRGASADVP